MNMYSELLEKLPLPYVYYLENGRKDFLAPGEHGDWVLMARDGVSDYLVERGYSRATVEDEDGDALGLSEVRSCLQAIMSRQNVSYAAPLAGYNKGFYEINGHKILVTQSPKLVIPKKGEFPLLQGILTNLLREEQLTYFYSWLHLSLQMFYARQWQPGQVLAIAGPPGSGKSLIQSVLTEVFGGREEAPYEYMMGKTDFNQELFTAEHLVIDDAAESRDIRTRREFGARIKSFSVVKKQRCHGKHATALGLTPLWRMTITLNDDPERLMVLPPLDGDVKGKLMLLKAYHADMPFPTETPQQIEAFRLAWTAELPAFVEYILGWKIPKEIIYGRTGMRTYVHPDLERELMSSTPEQDLLDIIDEVLFPLFAKKYDPWQGGAKSLAHELTSSKSEYQWESQKLLSSTRSCGIYLGRLAQSHPDRVIARKLTHNTNIWKIMPPSRDLVNG